ncbi:MAG: ABC-2 transporter permease [Peptostreptococcaceae bacterium]|nr:ABC-2 transporter permease [Peptostreptococcaceae bacterium]
MFDLIKKDIIVTLRSDKQLLLRYIATLFVFHIILNPFSYYSANVFFSFIILTNTFSYDKENNTNRFMMSMPINKEDVVYSRYILSLGIIIITTTINNIVYEIMGGKLYRGPVLNDVLISLILFLLIVSIMLPVFFKFKYSKWSIGFGYIIIFVIYIQVSVFLMLVGDSTINTDDGILNLYSLSFGAIIVFLLSMLLSLWIVNHDRGDKRYE